MRPSSCMRDQKPMCRTFDRGIVVVAFPGLSTCWCVVSQSIPISVILCKNDSFFSAFSVEREWKNSQTESAFDGYIAWWSWRFVDRVMQKRIKRIFVTSNALNFLLIHGINSYICWYLNINIWHRLLVVFGDWLLLQITLMFSLHTIVSFRLVFI